jgi:hemolysin type calcium-binding protein
MRILAAALTAIAVLAGAASAAVITGTARGDRLTGTPRADAIDGRAGKDMLFGLAGGDFLQGGPGRDTVDAGPGEDRIAAHGDGTRDRIRCGAGRDIVAAERADAVGADCEVVSRQVSADATTDPIGQHATQVEPDSFANGSTVVSVFQVGRVFNGGAVAIGYSTSLDAGATWRSGLLPGVTDSSPQPGPAQRASDPAIAYDTVHGTWLAATLGIVPSTSSFTLYVSRSPDGLAWSQPVTAVAGPTGTLDKEWIACDNWVSSPFRGHCYLSYYHVGSGELRTTTSVDGGLTWGQPVTSAPAPPRGIEYNGVQPVVLPDGTLVIPFNTFVDPSVVDGPSEIDAVRSADGGATFSPPLRAARWSADRIPAVRTVSLISAEADGAGRLYVVWEGCSGPSTSCSTSRINMTTTTDGVSWTPAQQITGGGSGVDHFLPGIGAGGPGQLALVYHAIPDDCADTPTCRGIDVFQRTSGDAGRTWSKPQRLTPEPMSLAWLPRTSLGLMLGDYVSTSFARGRPVSVFAIAAPRVGNAFREAIFAYRPRA